MNRKEQAVDFHHKKFNCAQAVVCTFAEEMGYDPDVVFNLTEAFGGGMEIGSTCGAVSAMAVVIGMRKPDSTLDPSARRKQTAQLMREAANMFLEKNKSVICREIKGLDGGPVLRSCDGCIEDAVVILEQLLLGIKE